MFVLWWAPSSRLANRGPLLGNIGIATLISLHDKHRIIFIYSKVIKIIVGAAEFNINITALVPAQLQMIKSTGSNI